VSAWRKSSFSQGHGECVMVAHLEDGSVLVRDSKLGEASPTLSFTGREWTAFLAGVRNNEFDGT
jgi:hypothetical protein